MAKQQRLKPDDWARAALSVVARSGVDAVAVEPIAAQLGTTKGSFYWHFENRDQLVEGALKLWERTRTDAVIRWLEAEPDPARRLRMLIEASYEKGPDDRVEIALLANPGHPVALRTIRRVTERRITYLAKQLEALGWEPGEARDRALLIAFVYVGRMQMAHIAKPSDTKARQRQVQLVLDALVGGSVWPPSVTASTEGAQR